LYLVDILFLHINDDALSKSLQTLASVLRKWVFYQTSIIIHKSNALVFNVQNVNKPNKCDAAFQFIYLTSSTNLELQRLCLMWRGKGRWKNEIHWCNWFRIVSRGCSCNWCFEVWNCITSQRIFFQRTCCKMQR